MADRSAHSPDPFYAAVKASAPGDSVTITGGSYPAFGVPPVNIAEPGVTVRPAAGAKVTLEGPDVSGSAGLKVSSIEIAVKTWGWKPALYCANASRNTFDRMVIHSARPRQPVEPGRRVPVQKCPGLRDRQ